MKTMKSNIFLLFCLLAVLFANAQVPEFDNDKPVATLNSEYRQTFNLTEGRINHNDMLEPLIDTTVFESAYRDLYTDTWVATDAIGRKMPTFNEVGSVKTDKKRVVSIFYIT